MRSRNALLALLLVVSSVAFAETTGQLIVVLPDGVGGGGGGASSFDELSGGTSTNDAFVVGNGSSMSATGTGTIAATSAATATSATTASDLTCTNCIGGTEIDESALVVPDASIAATIARDSEVAAGYQPLDSDLTSIAAISTTSFGRNLLALADQAALLSAAGAAAASHTHGVGDITGEHAGTDLAADLEEESHASEHQDGGNDELALDGSQITTGTVAEARTDAALHRDSETKDGDLVSFDDGDSNFAATDVDEAIEELDDDNASGPNASDGKVEWSQLVGVPAGFADETDASGGGGTPNILDLGDNGADESSDLVEIATTGDTNSIFSEPAGDKLLIAVGNDWPKADTSDDLTCTNCIGGTEVDESALVVPDASIAATIARDAELPNTFSTINAPNGTDPTAQNPADTLNLTGTTVLITGTVGADIIDFEVASYSLDESNMSDNDWGDFTITAPGGASIDANAVALTNDTTGNYVDDVTSGIGIAVTHTPGEGSDAAVAFVFTDAGTDPALGAGGATFSNEGASAAGLVFEGDTNDAHETRVRVTDATADRIVTIPNADSTTVQPDTGAANNFLTAISAAGVVSKAQPSFSNISGSASDGQVDGSAEADELVLAGDVDGTANSNDLDEAAVETELEGVLDLDALQSQIADAQIAAGAVDGGNAGEIADGSVTADDLGTDSVSADELNATGVESELEAVLEVGQLQGGLAADQVDTITDIAAALKSGLDAEVITGTIGTTNAVVTVDANDDLVELGTPLTWNITEATCTGDGNGGALTVNGSSQIVCSADAGGAGGDGDAVEVEDSDDGGTFSGADTTAQFEDSGDINFVLTDGGAGGPDQVSGLVRANAVALTTDTTGNYAAGDGEAGAALTGDSATSFFSAGAIENARGGTGQDSSGSTGVARVSSGTWSFAAGLEHLAAAIGSDKAFTMADGIELELTPSYTAGDANVFTLDFNKVDDGNATDDSDVMRIEIVSESGDAGDTTEGLVIEQEAGTANDVLDAALRITNLENATATMTDAIKIDATTTDSITDAIDVSDAEIANGINVGANPIISGAATLSLGNSSTTVIALTTDSTGDAEVTLPADSIGSSEVAGLADGDISDTLTASTSTTASADDNDTSISTTAFVQQELNAAGGRSLTCASGSCDVDQEAYEQTKCINVDPTNSITDWLFWRTERAITVIGIDCIVAAATSVVMTLNECSSNAASCGATEAAITCGTTNTTEASSIDDSAVDAGDWMRVTRGTVTGTPAQVNLCVTYTVAD